jgi:hypothetical protein
MVSGWRYLAEQLTGDGTQGELFELDMPLMDVEITKALSAPDMITATVAPEFKRLKGPNGRPLVEDWSTAIYAEADGDIRGGAILQRPSSDGPRLALECAGWAGYAHGMPYTDSWFGVEIDPLDVHRHIWEHLQGKPGGNLGYEIDDTLTGLKIGVELEQVEFDTESGPVSFEAGPVQLNWYTTDDLGQKIDSLSKETPYDYREHHFWDGDTIRHRQELGYPRLGRRLSDMRFVIGENVQIIPNVSVSDDYASEVLGLGAGEGRTMLRSHVTRPTNRLRRVAVVINKAARSQKSIDSVAKGELAWRHDALDVAEIVLMDHPNAPMGAVQPGDEIPLQGSTGWYDLDGWFRVQEVRIRPADANSVALTISRSDRNS